MLTPFYLPMPQLCLMAKHHWVNRAISNFASLFVIREEQPTEQRSIGISNTSGMMQLLNISDSGVSVTEDTTLGISALWCGVDLLCSVYATIPQRLYRKQNSNITEATNHPASILISTMPRDEYVPFDFKYSMRYNALMNGGGGAEIIRDPSGNPVSLRLMRHGCTPYKPFKNSPLTYYDNEDGQVYQPEDVLFLPGIMIRDGNKAVSLLTAFKNHFGQSLQTEKMVDQFLKLGPLLGGTYTFTGKLTDAQKESITNSFSKEFGGTQNAGKILPLGNAENFKQYQPVNFANSQMVEMKNFRIADVARILRMPENLLGSLVNANYNSLEQLFKQWKITALDPMFTRADQEANKKLLRSSQLGTYYFETDVDEMMWMDAQARAEYWKSLSHIGAVTPNEIRRYNNKNGVTGGDEPLVQMQMIPLSMAVSGAALKKTDNKDPRNKKSKRKDNPKQAVLFEETITKHKNGKHTKAAAN